MFPLNVVSLTEYIIFSVPDKRTITDAIVFGLVLAYNRLLIMYDVIHYGLTLCG